MNFQAKVVALMVGMAGAMAVLLFSVIMVSNLLLKKVDSAYTQGRELTLLVDSAQQAQAGLQNQTIHWKNILLRGNDEKTKQAYSQTYQDVEKNTQEQLAKLRNQAADLGMDEQAKRIETLISQHKALGANHQKELKKYPYLSYIGQQALDRSVKDTDLPLLADMNDLVTNITHAAEAQLSTQAKLVHQDVLKRNLIFLVLALLLSSGLMYFLFQIGKQLIAMLGDSPERVVSSASRIAKGDLTEELHAKRPDSLLGTLDMLQLRLRNIMLAVDSATQDFRSNVNLMDKSYQRKALEDTLTELEDAMRRIKVHRED